MRAVPCVSSCPLEASADEEGGGGGGREEEEEGGGRRREEEGGGGRRREEGGGGGRREEGGSHLLLPDTLHVRQYTVGCHVGTAWQACTRPASPVQRSTH